jgi:hypothetical protein
MYIIHKLQVHRMNSLFFAAYYYYFYFINNKVKVICAAKNAILV